MIDKTGQPRSMEDLKEALEQITKSMVQDAMKLPPALFVVLMTVRDALKELIYIRQGGK